MQNQVLLQLSGEWMIDDYHEAETTIFWFCPSPYAKDEVWYDWQPQAISTSADMQLCLPFLWEEIRQDQLRAPLGHQAECNADVPLI